MASKVESITIVAMQKVSTSSCARGGGGLAKHLPWPARAPAVRRDPMDNVMVHWDGLDGVGDDIKRSYNAEHDRLLAETSSVLPSRRDRWTVPYVAQSSI
jgi:hypothetical protein